MLKVKTGPHFPRLIIKVQVMSLLKLSLLQTLNGFKVANTKSLERSHGHCEWSCYSAFMLDFVKLCSFLFKVLADTCGRSVELCDQCWATSHLYLLFLSLEYIWRKTIESKKNSRMVTVVG